MEKHALTKNLKRQTSKLQKKLEYLVWFFGFWGGSFCVWNFGFWTFLVSCDAASLCGTGYFAV